MDSRQIGARRSRESLEWKHELLALGLDEPLSHDTEVGRRPPGLTEAVRQGLVTSRELPFTLSFEAEVESAGYYGFHQRTACAAAPHTRQRRGTSPPTMSANPGRWVLRFAPWSTH